MTDEVDAELLHELYTSVMDTNSLDGMMSFLADRFQDIIFTVQAHSTLSNENYHISAYNSDDAFFDDFWAVGHLNPMISTIARTGMDRVFRSADSFDPNDLDRSVFYDRLCRPRNEINRCNGIILRRERTDVAFLAANLPKRFPAQDEQRLNHTLDVIRVHAQNAFTLLLELNCQSTSTTETMFWLNQIPTPAIVIDSNSRIVALNGQAEGLFQGESPLFTTRSQKLITTQHGHALTLDTVVQDILRTGLPQEPAALAKPDGKSFVLTAAPMGSFGEMPLLVHPFASENREIFITIIDPDEVLPESKELLALSLGLSDRESALLQAMIKGASLKEAASGLGIAYNTARNQIASATKKLGVTSQTDLVRLGTQVLSQIPAGLL